MACAKKGAKKAKEAEKNIKHLNDAFIILKKAECLVFSDPKGYFSDTELRLISEILSAQYEGRRLISTQIASMLGVTRSAISQIVNRLETEGYVKRVADDVDRKIAYIVVTEKTLETYEKEIKGCISLMGRVMERYGDEKFEEMCKLFTEFTSIVEEEKKKCCCKEK